MFSRRQAATENAVGLLILLAISLADGLHSTTLSPSPSDLVLTPQVANVSMEEPLVLPLRYSPCREEHAGFCANDGMCMYPQDQDKPSCLCKPSFVDPRCMTLLAKSQTETQYKEVVGICTTVFFFLIVLIVFLWWIRKRWVR
ncbi:unnamed protein product [Merluccius merluccius]